MKTTWFSGTVALLILGGAAFAQSPPPIVGSVYPPYGGSGIVPSPIPVSGSVIYHAPPSGVIYSSPVVPGAIPFGTVPCGPPCPPGPSGNCPGPCNPPIIVNRPDKPGCHPVPVCVTIPVEYEPGMPDDKPTYIPFYKICKQFNDKVCVPAISTQIIEDIEFTTVCISLPCCDITVCVPCKRCEITSKQCVVTEKELKLEACLRRDGLVDVYVLGGVPQLPKKWVLDPRITLDAYKLKYKNGPPLP